MRRCVQLLLVLTMVSTFQSCTENVSADVCSTGGVLNLIASLPNGGVADLGACGSLSLEGPISFGTAAAPVTLKLGPGTVQFTNQTGNGFQIGGNGSSLIGAGPVQTVITTSSGFSGDIVHVEPVAELTTTGLEGIELANFGCDATNSPTAICIDAVAVRHASSFHNLKLSNMTGTALQITTSAVEGGRLSNITSVRDVYIQTSAEPLSADTVILKGDAIQFDSNNTIFTPAPQGHFRGLVLTPSPTNKGDGRGNNISHSVVEGYGTCISVEAPAGPNTGAIGNVITSNWLEECGVGYQFTGADANHLASNNQAFGNYCVSSTVNCARLDFASHNFIQEITHGNPGTVTLTSNSTDNTVIVNPGTSVDVSDFGFQNTVYTISSKSIHLNGDLYVGGTLSKAAGSFRIDHPLDPEHKYLQHSFVESPDMMNIYNGVAILDQTGSVEVRLPLYFEALNRDFRYQLTPIGGFAPLYIEREVKNNRFKIAGGNPGMRVSWQVTGIRHDGYANAHRIPVETKKPRQR